MAPTMSSSSVSTPAASRSPSASRRRSRRSRPSSRRWARSTSRSTATTSACAPSPHSGRQKCPTCRARSWCSSTTSCSPAALRRPRSMPFSVSTSSVNKGESLLDTVQTIDAMGVDAIVVRHSAAGAPHRVASWSSARVINAGDGCHEHPTQALLDAFTLRRHRGPSLDGCRIAIVGDVRHSRVARSNVMAFHALGCELTLVGPPTLMPERPDGWPVEVTSDLDHVLPEVDVVYLLRIQRERIDQALFPTLREYAARWGLNAERAARCKPDTLVMHPGPMNRGVEIAGEVADSSRSLVTEQVAKGVAVRMAVRWSLLGSGRSIV